MKKQLLYLALLLSSFGAWAQSVPQLINYQGIARRASGSTINNQSMGIQFKITQGPGGPVVFTETQTKTSNALGLFTAQIGSGSSSNLGTVNWSTGPYYLEVAIDTTGGTTYVSLGSQQLASVPYALAAPSPTLSYNNNVLTVGENSVGIFVGGASPSLSISGNTISISGGNSIPLPGITATNVTASGASSVTSSTGGVNIHTDSVTVETFTYLNTSSIVNTYGLAQVVGTWPHYKVVVDPQLVYNSATGILNLSSTPAFNPPYSFNYPVAPDVNLIGNVLSVGPKSVDINPVAPWRWDVAANTVSLAGIATQSVGINNTLNVAPTAELEVTGYTKLGSNAAPGIKMLKLTGTTASGTGGTTSISLTQLTTTYLVPVSRILAVSVLVDASASGTGDWVPPGNNLIGAFEYSWKINSSGVGSIDVTNGTGSSGIYSKPIKVLVTYEQ